MRIVLLSRWKIHSRRSEKDRQRPRSRLKMYFHTPIKMLCGAACMRCIRLAFSILLSMQEHTPCSAFCVWMCVFGGGVHVMDDRAVPGRSRFNCDVRACLWQPQRWALTDRSVWLQYVCVHGRRPWHDVAGGIFLRPQEGLPGDGFEEFVGLIGDWTCVRFAQQLSGGIRGNTVGKQAHRCPMCAWFFTLGTQDFPFIRAATIMRNYFENPK